MRDAGFTVNHAHNHGGQCFWEYLPADNIGKSEPAIEASKAELMRRWTEEKLPVDYFEHANDARNKIIK